MTAPAHPTASRRAATLQLAAIGTLLLIATAAGPALHHRLGGWALLGIFAVCGGGAYLAWRLVDRCDPRHALLIVLAGAIAMRLALLFVEPYLSTDVYRYIWDGRVQAAGFNPYRHMPGAAEVSHLRDPDIFPNINRVDSAVTIYPPIAQAFFLAITRLGESVVVMKLGLLAFEAATIAAIMALLDRQGLARARVAVYAWHPLPIWEIAGSGHVDAVMCALLMFGLVAFLGQRTLLAGVLVSLGALVKPTALLALPVFWRPWDWRLPLVVVATITIAYLPYLGVGAGVLGYLPGYLEEEGLNSGRGINLLWLLEWVLGPLPGYLRTIYVAAAALIMLVLALKVGLRSDRSAQGALDALRWLLVAFLILASPHYPWYFLVLVPFLVLSPSASAWVLTLGGVLLYDVIGGDVLPSYNVRLSLFTLATFAAVAFDIVHERRAAGLSPTWTRP